MSFIDPGALLNVKVEDEKTTFEKACPFCGKRHAITMQTRHFKRWIIEGEHIQRVLPWESADTRELMISGTCPECWNKAFGEI